MTIKRETLMKMRQRIRGMDYHPTREEVRMLLQACLEMHEIIEGGQTDIDFAVEVRKALKTVQNILVPVPQLMDDDPTLAVRETNHALYAVALADHMVRTKPPRRKPWKDMLPTMAEEFGE